MPGRDSNSSDRKATGRRLISMIRCEDAIGRRWTEFALSKMAGKPLHCAARLTAPPDPRLPPGASPLRTVLKYACKRKPGLMQCKLRTVLGGMRHTEEDSICLLPFLPIPSCPMGKTLALGIPRAQFHPFLVFFTSPVFSPTISTISTSTPPCSTCPAWLLPVPSASSDRIGSRQRSEISE